MLSLSPSEKSWSRVVSFSTNVCCLGGGVVQVKSNCPSFPFQCIQIHTYVFFNLQQFDGTTQLDSWTSAKAPSSMGLTVLWGGHAEEQEPVNKALQVLPPGPRCVCIVPEALYDG